MKLKEIEAKRSLTVPALKAELRATREKLFKAGFKHRVSKLDDPLQLRNLRRHAARLETWIRIKESSAPPSPAQRERAGSRAGAAGEGARANR